MSKSLRSRSCEITYEAAVEHFYYEVETGKVISKKTIPYSKTKIGQIMGYRTPQGHLSTEFKGKAIFIHRLAWLLSFGCLPEGKEIDHINGVRDDNRLCNLRAVTRRENCQNRVERRNGKLVGAFFRPENGKWCSKAKANNKAVYLGMFDTEIDAHLAYVGFLANLGLDVLQEG